MSPAAAQCLMCSVWKIALYFFMHRSSLFTSVKWFGFHVLLGLPEASSSYRVPKSTYVRFLCLTSLVFFFILWYFCFIAQLFLLCINLKILSFTVHLSSFSGNMQREVLVHLTWNTFQTSLFLSLTVICQADLTPVALLFFLDNK